MLRLARQVETQENWMQAVQSFYVQILIWIDLFDLLGVAYLWVYLLFISLLGSLAMEYACVCVWVFVCCRAVSGKNIWAIIKAVKHNWTSLWPEKVTQALRNVACGWITQNYAQCFSKTPQSSLWGCRIWFKGQVHTVLPIQHLNRGISVKRICRNSVLQWQQE